MPHSLHSFTQPNDFDPSLISCLPSLTAPERSHPDSAPNFPYIVDQIYPSGPLNKSPCSTDNRIESQSTIGHDRSPLENARSPMSQDCVIPLLTPASSTRVETILAKPEAIDHENGAQVNRKTTNSLFQCQKGCDKSFQSPKDLHRHHESRRHAPRGVAEYRCRCGYSTKRKDHYRRHLRNISGKRSCAYRERYFRCVCQHDSFQEDHGQHQIHLDTCTEGRRKPGRPKKEPPTDAT